MAKRNEFKQQILHITMWNLTIYCETEAGQYREECEAISKTSYTDYLTWAGKDGLWGHQLLGHSDGLSVNIVAKLPKLSDGQSTVNFCAAVAHCTLGLANPQNVNCALVGRLAGIIWANLKTEEIETEDELNKEEEA